MPFHAPNGFVYPNKKAYIKYKEQMIAIHASKNKISSTKQKAKKNRQRKVVTFGSNQKQIKYKKILPNDVRTASNTEDIKVIDSWDSREERRKYQNNVISIVDEDANVAIDLIDRENKLKPKREQSIITEEYQGDKIVTGYGKDGKKVSELHVQVRNLKPVDFDRTPSQLKKLSKTFETDLETLDTKQLKSLYDVATLRTLGNNLYSLPKSAPKLASGKSRKDEKQWYLDQIKSIIKVREMNKGFAGNKDQPKKEIKVNKEFPDNKKDKKEIKEATAKFGDITKIKKWHESKKDFPLPPHRNIKTTKSAGRVATVEEVEYLAKVRDNTNLNKNKLQTFEKNLIELLDTEKKVNKRPIPRLELVRKKFDSKYSRFEQDSFLFKLEKDRKIELSIASDQSVVSNFGSGIPTNNRGLIYYISKR